MSVSEHWHRDSTPSYALLEQLRGAVDSAGISYRQGFPPTFDSLGLKQPLNLTGLLSKVKQYVAKAERTRNYLQLCQEMTELSKIRSEVIGPACHEIGITPEWLENADVCSRTVTNHVVIELHQFRARKSITWKTVHDMWWKKCFLVL